MSKSTSEFDKDIEHIKMDDIGSYLKKNREDMIHDHYAFIDFIQEKAKSKRMQMDYVYNTAGISEGQWRKIHSGERRTKRGVVIKMCLVLKLSLDDTNHALKIYGMQPLYARNTQDAIIAMCITNNVYDLETVDRVLLENNQKPLG